MKLEKDKINLIKNELIQLLKNKFNEELEKNEVQLEHIKQAAIEAPGAMQSHHDVSKYEYSKLAVNLENEIMYFNEALKVLENYKIESSNSSEVLVGSLIETIHNSQNKVYFLLPIGRADTLENENFNEKITVINSKTPIGLSLINKKVGDMLEIGSGELKIINIY